MDYKIFFYPFAAAIIAATITAFLVTRGRSAPLLQEDKDAIMASAISIFFTVLIGCEMF